MKKVTSLMCFVMLCVMAWGQSGVVADTNNNNTPIYHNGGKVGIGIGTPTARFHIDNSTLGSDGFQVWNNVANYSAAYLANTHVSGSGVIVRGGNGTDRSFEARDYANASLFKIQGNGNVGIGTTSITSKLTIGSGDLLFTGNRNNTIFLNGDNTQNTPMLLIGEQKRYGLGFKWDSSLNLDIVQFDNQDVFNVTPTKIGHFRIRDKVFYWEGNVGIGMSTPGNKLHIGANNNDGIYIGKYKDRLGWDGTGEQPGYHIRFAGYRDVADAYAGARISALRTNNCCSGLSQGMELAFYVTRTADWASNGDVNLKEAMRINSNGNLAIGKSKADTKLDVDGTIRATEIKVEANGQTADFVFEDNYHLRGLSEVEAFINANKHLPEIPSADEMEESGVNLAEMNKLLLMKVEELTLYAIEQQRNRELEENAKQELQQELSIQKQKTESLEERLNQLEVKLQANQSVVKH